MEPTIQTDPNDLLSTLQKRIKDQALGIKQNAQTSFNEIKGQAKQAVQNVDTMEAVKTAMPILRAPEIMAQVGEKVQRFAEKIPKLPELGDEGIQMLEGMEEKATSQLEKRFWAQEQTKQKIGKFGFNLVRELPTEIVAGYGRTMQRLGDVKKLVTDYKEQPVQTAFEDITNLMDLHPAGFMFGAFATAASTSMLEKGAVELAEEGAEKALPKVVGLLPSGPTAWKGFSGDLTLKAMNQLKDKAFTTADEMTSILKSASKGEYDIIKEAMERTTKMSDGSIPIQDMADRIEPYLTPLKPRYSNNFYDLFTEKTSPPPDEYPSSFVEKFENYFKRTGETNLPALIDSNMEGYFETAYESPFISNISRHSWTDVTDKYFGHIRSYLLKLKNGKKVLFDAEVQNDLFQQGSYKSLYSKAGQLRNNINARIRPRNELRTEIKNLNKADNLLNAPNFRAALDDMSLKMDPLTIDKVETGTPGDLMSGAGGEQWVVKKFNKLDNNGQLIEGEVIDRFNTMEEAGNFLEEVTAGQEALIEKIERTAKDHGVSKEQISDLIERAKRGQLNASDVEIAQAREDVAKQLAEKRKELETSEANMAELQTQIDSLDVSENDKLKDRFLDNYRHIFRERVIKERLKLAADLGVDEVWFPRGKTNSYMQKHTQLPTQENVLSKDAVQVGKTFTDPKDRYQTWMTLDVKGDKVKAVKMSSIWMRNTAEDWVERINSSKISKVRDYLDELPTNPQGIANSYLSINEAAEYFKGYVDYLHKKKWVPKGLADKLKGMEEYGHRDVENVWDKYMTKKIKRINSDKVKMVVNEGLDEGGSVIYNIFGVKINSKGKRTNPVKLGFYYDKARAERQAERMMTYIDDNSWSELKYVNQNVRKWLNIERYSDVWDDNARDYAKELAEKTGISKDATDKQIMDELKKRRVDDTRNTYEYIKMKSPDSGKELIAELRNPEYMDLDLNDMPNPFEQFDPNTLSGTNRESTKYTAQGGHRRIYEAYETELPEFFNTSDEINATEFMDNQTFTYSKVDLSDPNTRDFFAKWQIPVLSLLPFMLALRGGGQNNPQKVD